MIVVKFGGELLEDETTLDGIVSVLAAAHAAAAPFVVVHGGGRAIDAGLETAGIAKQQVDGLRITDPATLDVVVAVLAGAVNTRLVAALAAAGVPAVGLTGADDACGLCEPAPFHRTVDGRSVDLGHVGQPSDASSTRLLQRLLVSGFVPVVASIGIGGDGRLFNVNADTLAGHLAGRLGARRLVVAGTTAGVLDRSGATVPLVGSSDIEQLVGSGTACSGSCPVVGESCVDPDAGGSAAAMCMGGAGTDANPYYTQDYMWWMHLYRVELIGTFNFQSYAFGDRVTYLTHESSNEAVFQ